MTGIVEHILKVPSRPQHRSDWITSKPRRLEIRADLANAKALETQEHTEKVKRKVFRSSYTTARCSRPLSGLRLWLALIDSQITIPHRSLRRHKQRMLEEAGTTTTETQ